MNTQRKSERRRLRVTGTVLGVALASLATAGLITASAGEAAPRRVLVAPANTAPPTISGAAEVGQTLTASTGSWSGTVISFFYQWARCGADGTGCQNIAGATSQNYVISSSDVGHALVIFVSASNGSEFGTAYSAATKEVLDAPRNTSPPTIGGIVALGQTLTATTGSWDTRTSTSYTFQWTRCNSGGGSCGNIPGATSQKYVPVSADVGNTLLVYVSAHDAAGSSTAHSATTAVVAGSTGAPQNTQAPTISGTVQSGQTLTANVGKWSSSLPLAYNYQWVHCDSAGNNCANIGGATKSTFVIPDEVIGMKLFVYVTAVNQAGYSTAHSALTAVVGGGPQNTGLPTISGQAQVGQTLTANVGQWSSSLPITSYTYQWVRCDSAGQNCANIVAATKSTYVLQQGEAAHRVFVYVTASNSRGPTTAQSALTAVVASGPAGPAGVVNIGNGKQSIPASSVTLPARLVINNLSFQPKRIQGRAPFLARFHVSDTRGYSVRGAKVYALGLPYSWVQKGVTVTTDTNGWATMTITPTRKLPTGRGHAIVIFVRAVVPGQPVLAGSSTRRLVQITTAGK